MITQAQYLDSQRQTVKTVRLNAHELAALEDMANNLGVPEAVLIRDGLERVYQEYQIIKAGNASKGD